MAWTQLGPFISITGFSTYTEEAKFPLEFRINRERLWKLQKMTSYETPHDKIDITQMYPKEVEFNEIDENHFGIRPVKPVRPETFKEVSTLQESEISSSEDVAPGFALWYMCKVNITTEFIEKRDFNFRELEDVNAISWATQVNCSVYSPSVIGPSTWKWNNTSD